jgi:hypothetical protein
MAFKTSVPREKLENIAAKVGCDVDTKASYIKVTKGKSTNCLFVAKTKDVSRIDIGGFDVIGDPHIKNLGGEAHGCVHQQIRSDISMNDFIGCFTKLCEQLENFESHPKKDRVRPHTFRGGKKNKIQTPAVVIVTDETPQQAIDRLVKKLTIAKQTSDKMGIPLSPKLLNDINAQIEKARQQIGA